MYKKNLRRALRSNATSVRWRARVLQFSATRLAISVGTVLALAVLLSIHFLPDKVSLRVGDRSPQEIRATRSVAFVDTEATARRREFAAQRIPKTYESDNTALAVASNAVTQFFHAVDETRSQRSSSNSQKIARLSATLGGSLQPKQLAYLVTTSLATLDRLQTTARRLVEAEMVDPIHSDTDELERSRKELNEAAQRSVASTMDSSILQAVGRQALRPNEIYNRRRTDIQREMARRNSPLIPGEVRLGDIIIRPAEIFTQQHLDKCAALGLVSPSVDLITAAAILALASGMVLIVGFYIRLYDKALYEDPKRLLLLSIIVVFSVVGLKIFNAMFGVSLSWVQFGYLGMMAVVAAGMLIAVLLNVNLAILITALLSVQSGLIMNHEIRFAVLTMVGSLVGIFSVTNIRDRGHLLRASLALAATNVATVWILGGLLGDAIPEVMTGTAWALAAAALAIATFWFGVAVLEKPFGILTHVWLLELSASERPLLRQLCVTAPGTYAHSIMVGNLAEAAAEAIGADTLFCRVASYYHDIGKMRRPHCFVENQRGGNIHEKLNPSLSALIISSHVRDGMDMADEYRLPRQIKAIIGEHHGTSLIHYFYHQALMGSVSCSASDPVLEQHFRYDGPRPQTRESGIIMLADCVEAASRAMDRPTPARIRGLVESLVHDKLTDGQLDESNLAFQDLHKIQTAFVRVLSGMLHRRLEYPEMPGADGDENEKPEGRLSAAHGSIYPEFTNAASIDQSAVARGTGRPGE